MNVKSNDVSKMRLGQEAVKVDLFIGMIYVLTFISGAVALMYEVVWFRSLSLIFGGAHLAVTTTVSVFMAGLALGNWLAGRYLKQIKNPLCFYAGLEFGIAVSAVFFLLLVRGYSEVYPILARFSPSSPTYLTFLRVVFAFVAMIVPTTLMGATIPVLVVLVTARRETMARHLSYLYGFNTFGAVTGTAVTGFYLLTVMSVNRVVWFAILLNFLIGSVTFILYRSFKNLNRVGDKKHPPSNDLSAHDHEPLIEVRISEAKGLLYRLVLVGIGISGFCALGYEVLWTRVLILFVDGSTYGFTTMLVSFLLGISSGGMSYNLVRQLVYRRTEKEDFMWEEAAALFGLSQVAIGLSTLLAINLIFDLPEYWIFLQKMVYKVTGGIFSAQQFGNFLLEFSILFAPSFFMGLAIPLAGKVIGHFREHIGQAAGEALSYNTVGGILGGACAGFLLIQLFGIERSFYLLIALNISLGLLTLAERRNFKPAMTIVPTAFIGLLLLLLFDKGALCFWNVKYLASYTQNRASYYADLRQAKKMMDSMEVLYYAEGREAVVSTIRHKDNGMMTFSTNGRIEATTELEDVQLQYLLGHLPMLLHKGPKKALNVGLGAGMSLGAISAYPQLDSIVLAEIEPKVIGVARTFSDWNHQVMDNPRLRIEINDARNYLLTTEEQFDVIAMDPLQPFWRGSGYLYSTEYFKLVADHLAPGGITAQYLPMYHLSEDNMKSIVKSFLENFDNILIWGTVADTILIGSKDPLQIDTQLINKRLAENEAVRNDLAKVMMGSSDELLTYFIMGTDRAEALAKNAKINSDDNLYIEFSSPKIIGDNSIESKNLRSLVTYRESVVPYLAPLQNEFMTTMRNSNLTRDDHFQKIADQAQLLYLQRFPTPEQIIAFKPELDKLPEFGRWQALKLILMAQLPK